MKSVTVYDYLGNGPFLYLHTVTGTSTCLTQSPIQTGIWQTGLETYQQKIINEIKKQFINQNDRMHQQEHAI